MIETMAIMLETNAKKAKKMPIRETEWAFYFSLFLRIRE